MTRMDVFLCDRAMTREYYTLNEEHMSFQAVMSEVFLPHDSTYWRLAGPG